jgi:nucleotide-binding universal stress UspA family protein
MLQKILVPLDGSELAEAVLPYVEEICQRCDPVEVILLQVVRLPSARSASVFRSQADQYTTPQPVSRRDAEIAQYPIYLEQELASARAAVEASLQPVVQRLRSCDIAARVKVAFGRPAYEIVRFAEREEMDLIAMSTHGRSGLTRWILGSVADRVSRGTRLPVLLVRPPGLDAGPFPPQPEIGL